MKHFTKKKLAFLSIIISCFIALLTPNFTFAAVKDDCTQPFFGLTPLDCGVEDQPQSEDQLKTNVIMIASNVLTDLTIIAAYLVIGYVIYGGYQYMFSSGDPTKAANGKKTLLHAFIGLTIVMSASVIVGAIRIALIGNTSFANAQTIDTNTMVTNLIQWAIGIAGVVAGVFLVIGGISYITSAGDSNKLQKAKSTILYAVIGLIIVALAEIGTAFISGLIRDAQKPAAQALNTQSTIIGKES